MTIRILIVDDDQGMCEMLKESLSRRNFDVTWSTSPKEALDIIKQNEFDVFLTDLQMPGIDGIELCRSYVERRPDVPVVVFTAFGNMDTAIAALRAGAYDFVNKPFELDTLTLVLERAAKHRNLLDQVKILQQTIKTSKGFDELIGSSPVMQEVFDLIKRITNLDSSVLITGESGTGKELVAGSLHRHSPHKKGPFVALNCSAVPETLLESELFGHSRGAFTDAHKAREGIFVQAHGGTILLDEIADMPLQLQPKLLRALENRTVRPVGGDSEVPFDVRILAATNRDIESMVAEGKFRQDLYYRLNVIQIHLPPLRARNNDVLLLADKFLEEFTALTGKRITGISTPAAKKLLSYNWPGNVRELRNCMERAVALTQFDKITVDDLTDPVINYTISNTVMVTDNPAELLTMEEIERRYMAHILSITGNNKTMAAKILDMDRKTLYRKLEKYKLDSDSINPPNDKS
jgi:two-component system response regulator AtoC